jgi:PKD repeat protein
MLGLRNLGAAIVLTLFLPFGPSGQLQAQTCEQQLSCAIDSCRTPARPVPSTLWGELRPVDTAIPDNRDSTNHNGFQAFSGTNPFWFSMDIENGWIFTAYTSGFEIWDATTTPDIPMKGASVDGRKGGFPAFPANLEEKFPVSDADAPAGNDDLLAVAAGASVGLSIWDTSDKGGPRARYQNFGAGQDYTQVYAARVGGTNYAFAAGSSAGLRMYDMDRAAALTQVCLDEAPATGCGVYRGRLGTRESARYVSGTGNFVAVSSGVAPKGLDLWNLTNPSSPVLAGIWAASEIVYGHAMWSEDGGSKVYLAARVGGTDQLRIYDVSCLASGGGACTPSAPVGVVALGAPATESLFVTFSRSGGTPFLYVAGSYLCGGSQRQEWLLDVTNPSAPRDITPPNGVANGFATGYWQWYGRNTPTGFNWVGARKAKFWGNNLYRAAAGIFDIHKLAVTTPLADFSSSPTQIFVGTPVAFTDRSTGTPTSWAWSFEGGTPSIASVQNPSGVTFSSVGPKTVRLNACNDRGCDDLAKTINVVNPEAAVGGLTVSPASLTSCLTATFTATGVTGAEPFSYAWSVTPAGGSPETLPCTSNPCTWVVPVTKAGGTYEVRVNVSNAALPAGAEATTPFTITQEALGFVSGPTSDPTTTGVVQFHVQTTGAMEWSWDFGDSTNGFGPWSSNFTTGPNPTHQYLLTGTYPVRVRIRDCTGQELIYPTPLLVSVTAIPLVASFDASCFGGYCAFDTGKPITFTDSSTGGVQGWSYDWTHTGTDAGTCVFGPEAAAPTTVFSYSLAGTYYPCLKVTRGNDSSVALHSKPILVAKAVVVTPKVTISGPATGTTGQAATFSASATNCSPSSNGWKWTTGGGSGSSTTNSISITWSSSGAKLITASNTACGSASASKGVSISGTSTGTALSAQFTYSPTTISPGQSVTFSGASSTGSPTVYSWKFGDGTPAASGAVVEHTYASAGSYSVTLSIAKPGSGSGCIGGYCTSDLTKTVVVGGGSGGTLAAAFTYSPTSIASGQSVTFNGSISTGGPTTYLWNFGDGSGTASGAQATHTFASAGTYSVTLSVGKPGTGPGCFNNICTDDEVKAIVVSGTATPPPVAAYTYSPTPAVAGKATAFDASSSTGSPTSWVWDFGDGTPIVTGKSVQHTFANPGSYSVNLVVSKPGSGAGCAGGLCSDAELKTIVVEAQKLGLCTDDPLALCLNDGRFKVQTTWKKPGGETGQGKPIGITDNTGYFWFEYDSNVEIVAKVLDGCTVNGNHWVFAAGLTNIEVTMTVIDKQTGAMKTYTNAQGAAFEPIQDTKAFSCTGANVTTEMFDIPSSEAPAEWVEVGEGDPIPAGVPYVLSSHSEAVVNATCIASETALCLNGGRFRVEAWWQTAEGLGTGQAVSLGADTGYFWFFNKENVELIIKVLDGCALNSRYWVFAGGLTNVGVRIIVTDTVRGDIKQYENPVGVAFPPQQDTNAIDECF